MPTITLKANEKIYGQLLRLLKKFNPGELEVVEEEEHFKSTKAYLSKELEGLEKADFFTLEEAEETLNAIIRENKQ